MSFTFLLACLLPACYGHQDTSSVEDLATLLLAMHPSAGNTQLGKTRSSVPVSGVKERNEARSSLTETASGEDGPGNVENLFRGPAIKSPVAKVASSIYSTYKETGTLLGTDVGKVDTTGAARCIWPHRRTLLGTDVGKVDTTGAEIPELKVLEEMQAFLEEEIPEEVSDLMLQALTIEMPVRPDASEMKELSMEEKRAYLNSQRLS
eukprot:CAMPEP_0169264822 /NCGR_PEP_ID=MMETSP1016-20121227/45342_1 /TAXON_ID=342587 /ORGANISM="Karlodinium micrum, Strain CCMP2283" /LENGTH=206 /DNA_ID=CAMNT_0009348233 /DNA_START=54 /DNA_END=674 /DNA_ORIENTATION=+